MNWCRAKLNSVKNISSQFFRIFAPISEKNSIKYVKLFFFPAQKTQKRSIAFQAATNQFNQILSTFLSHPKWVIFFLIQIAIMNNFSRSPFFIRILSQLDLGMSINITTNKKILSRGKFKRFTSRIRDSTALWKVTSKV